MSAITIGGVAIDCTSGGYDDPTYIGDETRASAGALRNAITAEKRNFHGVSIPVADSVFTSLMTAISKRAQVTVTGPLIKGDSITAAVTAKMDEVAGLPGFCVIQFVGSEA